MKVIIEIPDAMLNGVAGLFTMMSPDDSSEIMSAMDKCHETDKLELSLDSNDEQHTKIKASIATLAFTQVLVNDLKENEKSDS